MPVTTENGKWTIVPGLEIDTYSRDKLDIEARELQEEKNSIKHLLG
jgi:malate dehydrogenase